MKKFFSLIALVGVFAACQPEKLTTAFEVGNATATISVKVIDVLTGNDVTSSATISSATTLTGTPALAEQDYTVSASYMGGTGSATVHINALKAGGKAAYSIVIPVGGSIGDYTITVVENGSTTEKVADLVLAESNDHYYKYLHGGYEKWIENASEFILEDSYSYNKYTGTELVGEPVVLVEEFKDAVENAANGYNKGIEVEGTDKVDFSVSAWALFNVFGVEEYVITDYNVVATPSGNARAVGTDGVVGTFKAQGKQVVFVEPVTELPHPDYASHYIYGHGTGYKDGANAGGGIVEAE